MSSFSCLQVENDSVLNNFIGLFFNPLFFSWVEDARWPRAQVLHKEQLPWHLCRQPSPGQLLWLRGLPPPLCREVLWNAYQWLQIPCYSAQLVLTIWYYQEERVSAEVDSEARDKCSTPKLKIIQNYKTLKHDERWMNVPVLRHKLLDWFWKAFWC